MNEKCADLTEAYHPDLTADDAFNMTRKSRNLSWGTQNMSELMSKIEAVARLGKTRLDGVRLDYYYSDDGLISKFLESKGFKVGKYDNNLTYTSKQCYIDWQK